MKRKVTVILFALALASTACTRTSDDAKPGMNDANARAAWWGDDEEDEEEEGDEEEEDEGDDRRDGSDRAADDESEAHVRESDDGFGEDDVRARTPADPGPVAPRPTDGSIKLPPANAAFDYQLGGDYPPPKGVEIVARDRTGEIAPAPVKYNVCYINGLQTQPGELDFWLSSESRSKLVLRDRSNNPFVDPEWRDERFLDISTPEKRAAIANIEAEWIAECKRKGFDAIELDNLDSYTRSNGLLEEEHAVAFVRLLSDKAHALGLAVAQKNSSEIAHRKKDLGTDFAVTEQCNYYGECDKYTAKEAYGSNVLVIEYDRAAFTKGCREYPELSIVLRDKNLVTPDQRAYLFQGC